MGVQEKVEAHKVVAEQIDLDGIFKGYKKLEKSEKEKNKHIKEKVKELTRKREEKQTQV